VTPSALGTHFISAVRKGFGSLFRDYGFSEVGAEDKLSYASVTTRNATHYLRVSCDFRDRTVDVGLGHLREGLVPPVPIAPPRAPSEVREIPGAVIVWLGTGDKEGAFELGEYTTEESVEFSVDRLARALGQYGARILAGDQVAWDRAAELTVTRTWHP